MANGVKFIRRNGRIIPIKISANMGLNAKQSATRAARFEVHAQKMSAKAKEYKEASAQLSARALARKRGEDVIKGGREITQSLHLERMAQNATKKAADAKAIAGSLKNYSKGFSGAAKVAKHPFLLGLGVGAAIIAHKRHKEGKPIVPPKVAAGAAAAGYYLTRKK